MITAANADDCSYLLNIFKVNGTDSTQSMIVT
ncbi:hypothetical protein PALA111701_03795 [Paenibacillus lactis]